MMAKAGEDHLAAMLARIHVVRVASMYLMDIVSTCFPAVFLLPRMVNEHVYYISQYLVGGLSPSEKYESQLG